MGDEIVGASAESRHGVLEQGERAGEGGGERGRVVYKSQICREE